MATIDKNKHEPIELLQIIEESPAYWRVIFDNPPINLIGADMYFSIQKLLNRVDEDPNLRVVVFESNNPDFFLAHFDVSDPVKNAALSRTAGPSGLSVVIDSFVRLTRSSVVSIAKIRGRARGAGSEFALACDIRFASKEKAILSQLEVGSGLFPGGGGTERLPQLVGRGRALEIILGSDDFDGETAERYGWVNRTLPDAELDEFVDKFARRIASFDRNPIAAAKQLVNDVSLPPADQHLKSLALFRQALGWPETHQRLRLSFERGLNQYSDFELNFGEQLPKLNEK